MNNYNYFDTFNNPYMNNNFNDLYGAYEGYLKGNMFKNLYEQYKEYKPKTIIPSNEKEQELFNLNQIGFAMHDLNLYLDVFPNDTRMINLFTKYKDTYNDLLTKYEKKYGPINVSGTNDSTPFNWVTTKFPWEVI